MSHEMGRKCYPLVMYRFIWFSWYQPPIQYLFFFEDSLQPFLSNNTRNCEIGALCLGKEENCWLMSCYIIFLTTC